VKSRVVVNVKSQSVVKSEYDKQGRIMEGTRYALQGRNTISVSEAAFNRIFNAMLLRVSRPAAGVQPTAEKRIVSITLTPSVQY
jgi:hypothetical protein